MTVILNHKNNNTIKEKHRLSSLMNIDTKISKENVSKTISIKVQYITTKWHLFQNCNVDLTLENCVFCPFNRVRKKNNKIISIKVEKI